MVVKPPKLVPNNHHYYTNIILLNCLTVYMHSFTYTFQLATEVTYCPDSAACFLLACLASYYRLNYILQYSYHFQYSYHYSTATIISLQYNVKLSLQIAHTQHWYTPSSPVLTVTLETCRVPSWNTNLGSVISPPSFFHSRSPGEGVSAWTPTVQERWIWFCGCRLSRRGCSPVHILWLGLQRWNHSRINRARLLFLMVKIAATLFQFAFRVIMKFAGLFI